MCVEMLVVKHCELKEIVANTTISNIILKVMYSLYYSNLRMHTTKVVDKVRSWRWQLYYSLHQQCGIILNSSSWILSS